MDENGQALICFLEQIHSALESAVASALGRNVVKLVFTPGPS